MLRLQADRDPLGPTDHLIHLSHPLVSRHVSDHYLGAITREHTRRAALIPDDPPEMMATLPASLMADPRLFERCSAAGEFRPALLGEGPYRFLVVLGKV